MTVNLVLEQYEKVIQKVFPVIHKIFPNINFRGGGTKLVLSDLARHNMCLRFSEESAVVVT